MRYLAFSDKGDKTEVQDAHMKKPRTIGFTESGQSVTMVTLLGGKYLRIASIAVDGDKMNNYNK